MALKQTQSQRQIQKLSQVQIQAVSFLALSNKDLRDAIYKELEENPALELVRDVPSRLSSTSVSASYDTSSAYNELLENTTDNRETLQEHLLTQVNSMALSADENAVCTALIYNLDKNGCYGNMMAPKTLLDKGRPAQNEAMLQKCMTLVQSLDPVGCCCKNLEESLFIQAKIAGNAPKAALFLLDGHLDLLDPPQADRVSKKLLQHLANLEKKTFNQELPFSKNDVSEEMTQKAINFILKLNPHPAADFSYDTSLAQLNTPDIVLKVVKVPGSVSNDDFEKGIVKATQSFHYEVRYTNKDIPEIAISKEFLPSENAFSGQKNNANLPNSTSQEFREKCLLRAQSFVNSLEFRQSTAIMQGSAIVARQKEFFQKGPGHISPLTRRSIAAELNIHESTVSRFSSKHNGKYVDTEFGTFPLSYFFSSAPTKSQKSAEEIQFMIRNLLEQTPTLSDNELTKLLDEKGIQISRRTVAKYRSLLGIKGKFNR